MLTKPAAEKTQLPKSMNEGEPSYKMYHSARIHLQCCMDTHSFFVIFSNMSMQIMPKKQLLKNYYESHFLTAIHTPYKLFWKIRFFCSLVVYLKIYPWKFIMSVK